MDGRRLELPTSALRTPTVIQRKRRSVNALRRDSATSDRGQKTPQLLRILHSAVSPMGRNAGRKITRGVARGGAGPAAGDAVTVSRQKGTLARWYGTFGDRAVELGLQLGDALELDVQLALEGLERSFDASETVGFRLVR